MPLVDSEEAKVMFTRLLKAKGTSSDRFELCAFVKAEEARDLARLEEVKLVRAGGRCGSVPLHALEQRAFRDGHLELHILTLVLVEVHLGVETQLVPNHRRKRTSETGMLWQAN